MDADHQALLNVSAPARSGDDCERARQIVPDRGKELCQVRKDALLGK
jgi:hypothetical protein